MVARKSSSGLLIEHSGMYIDGRRDRSICPANDAEAQALWAWRALRLDPGQRSGPYSYIEHLNPDIETARYHALTSYLADPSPTVTVRQLWNRASKKYGRIIGRDASASEWTQSRKYDSQLGSKRGPREAAHVRAFDDASDLNTILDRLSESMAPAERRILAFYRREPWLSQVEIAALANCTDRYVRRIISRIHNENN